MSTQHTNLNVSYLPTNRLVAYAQNAKQHPEKQVFQIANSIKQFGFITPIVVDGHNEIIAGHGRLLAAKELGLEQVPVISVVHLSDAEVRAYRLADNKLNMNSGFDVDILRVELSELQGLELDFSLEITGFETPEIDLIFSHDTDDIADEDDLANVVVPENAVTKVGDIWFLGNHKLICGDSTDATTYTKLMGDSKAQAVFTDPPYNVPIGGHVCGNGQVKHREFAMASGEMSEPEFIQFLEKFMQCSANVSHDGALQYICMDWRHMYELISAGRSVYSELKNICVWNKDNGGMGSLYRSKHEFVAVYKHGTAPHINHVELGKHGRYRTNVWDYKGVNSFGINQKDLALHPTVKPVAMIVDAIMDCTKHGQIVLDPFCGSGSTLIACEKSKRVARCIELDPLYCDVIIQRWQKLTGKDAVQKESGMIFNDMKQVMEASNND